MQHDARRVESAGIITGDGLGTTSVSTLTPEPAEENNTTNRALLRRAARVLRGAAGQRETDPDLLVAAELVLEAGRR